MMWSYWPCQTLTFRFPAKCEAARMRTSTSKSKAMVLSWIKVDSSLQVWRESLPQAEKLKYLGVLFMNDGRTEQEIDSWIESTPALMWMLWWSRGVQPESKTFKSSVNLHSNMSIMSCGCGYKRSK